MTIEEELLGETYIGTKNELQKQTTQMGGGFYQLSRRTTFEEQYPNALDGFLGKNEVKEIADKAGITTDALSFPYTIDDDTINRINEILEGTDPLNLSDSDLTTLRAEIDSTVGNIDVPDAEQLAVFIDAVKKFASNASSENISIPTNTREITLVSTDISLDSFIFRTGIHKLIAISLNNLAYPFITERYHIPSALQATISNFTGTKGGITVTYSTINYEAGSSAIIPGSMILVSNNARNILNVEQQKLRIEWISETSGVIRVNTPLLFDWTSNHVVEIYKYTKDKVLSPGEMIKIPQ